MTPIPSSITGYLKNNQRLIYLAAALVFSLLAAVFYLPFLSAMPTGIHTWAQTDRLALAINFYDYGLNFLKPRTFSLTSIGGVTGVEFPLQPYLVALLAQIFGRDSIVVLFRLLNVSAVSLGFYYLFRLVYERTGHFVAGLVPAAFLLASPTFAFYAGAFTPDTFSFSLGFIGFYYWLRFFEQRQSTDLSRALLILTVAGLVKTTMALYFGAVLGITLLWGFLQPELLSIWQRRLLLGLAIVGVGLVLFFFFYNQALNSKYLSTQFMATANPISDPETLHEIVKSVRRQWLYEYGTITHFRMLLTCLALAVIYLRFNLIHRLPLLLLFGTSVGVFVVFLLLMGGGLGGHDYHMICALGPPALLILLLALLNIGRYTGFVRVFTSLSLLVLCVFLLANAYKRLHRRMSDDYPPFSPYEHIWMRGGATEMQQARVPAAAKILVLGESSINVALVYFDRQGLIWRPHNLSDLKPHELMTMMAAYGLDYLVMSPATYNQLAPIQADLTNAFEQVGTKPALVLRRRDHHYPW